MSPPGEASPIITPPSITTPDTTQAQPFPQNVVESGSAPPGDVLPVAAPSYTTYPNIVRPNTAQPYAHPPYTAPPYSHPQQTMQRTKPAHERKSKFMPIFILSVSVVTVALVAVALYFALGIGKNDPAEDVGLSDTSNETEDVSLGTDKDQDSASDSEPASEPANLQLPEEATQDETDSDFVLTEDGSGFIFMGIEFQIYEIILDPMFAPADMPDGHTPFMVRLAFKPDANTDDILSSLYESGYFMVGDEKAIFGAAMLLENDANYSIYSLVSSCSQITDSTPVTLYIGDNEVIVQ